MSEVTIARYQYHVVIYATLRDQRIGDLRLQTMGEHLSSRLAYALPMARSHI